MKWSEIIRRALTGCRLDVETAATLSGLEHLGDVVAGRLEPSAELLDTFARLMGTELEHLAEGRVGAPALFFRSMREDVVPGDILGAHDALILGDFIRCTGRVAHVRALLDEALPEPRWREAIAPQGLVARRPPGQQGEQLALAARKHFSLPAGPIPSMRGLLNAHGIEVFFAQPGRFVTALDGACTQTPAPAVLVNPIYAGAPWSFRATMAHELCHLLHDRKKGREMFISPASKGQASGRPAWDLFERYQDMERRANAFAAHFLAPLEEVRRIVAETGVSPETPEAALAVCGALGTSYELAVNQVVRAYRVSEESRLRLLRAPGGVDDSFAYDEAPLRFGLYEGQLRELVLRALSGGLLDTVEARMLLGIPMDRPLPQSATEPVHDRLLAPVVSRESLVLKKAWRILLEKDPSGSLSPGSPQRAKDGWQVQVVDLSSPERATSGVLTLNNDHSELRYAPPE